MDTSGGFTDWTKEAPVVVSSMQSPGGGGWADFSTFPSPRNDVYVWGTVNRAIGRENGCGGGEAVGGASPGNFICCYHVVRSFFFLLQNCSSGPRRST